MGCPCVSLASPQLHGVRRRPHSRTLFDWTCHRLPRLVLQRRVAHSTFEIPMAETSTAVIASANSLSVKYGSQVLLDGATIAFREGEHIGLVGRNGSGKSTFLQ